MEIRFVLPDLAKLDEIDAEVLAFGVFEDVRPARGAAGLADFRAAGRLSRLMSTGFLTGSFGERVLVPGKPRLSFEKLIAFGAGRLEAFDEIAVERWITHVLDTLEGLAVRSAALEIPARLTSRVPPATSARILFELAHARGAFDVWTLVETLDGRSAIEKMIAERKRLLSRPQL